MPAFALPRVKSEKGTDLEKANFIGGSVKFQLPSPALKSPYLGLASTVIIDASLLLCTLLTGLAGMYGFVTLTEMEVLERGHVTLCLALAAPLVTMVAYVSPIPVVVDAVKKMSVQNLPTQVFQLQVCCNILSICYGIQIMNAAVLVTNMFGLALQICFLAADQYVRTSNTGWFAFAMKLTVSLNIGLYVMATKSPLNILGHSITLFNIAMFATPCMKVGGILRTKNASVLPTTMTVLSVCNNAVWAMYAMLIQDTVVLLPSVLGYILSGFQVLVILWCRDSLPFDLGWLLLFAGDSSRIGHGTAASVKLTGDDSDQPDVTDSPPEIEMVTKFGASLKSRI